MESTADEEPMEQERKTRRRNSDKPPVYASLIPKSRKRMSTDDEKSSKNHKVLSTKERGRNKSKHHRHSSKYDGLKQESETRNSITDDNDASSDVKSGNLRSLACDNLSESNNDEDNDTAVHKLTIAEVIHQSNDTPTDDPNGAKRESEVLSKNMLESGSFNLLNATTSLQNPEQTVETNNSEKSDILVETNSSANNEVPNLKQCSVQSEDVNCDISHEVRMPLQAATSIINHTLVSKQENVVNVLEKDTGTVPGGLIKEEDSEQSSFHNSAEKVMESQSSVVQACLKPSSEDSLIRALLSSETLQCKNEGLQEYCGSLKEVPGKISLALKQLSLLKSSHSAKQATVLGMSKTEIRKLHPILPAPIHIANNFSYTTPNALKAASNSLKVAPSSLKTKSKPGLSTDRKKLPPLLPMDRFHDMKCTNSLNCNCFPNLSVAHMELLKTTKIPTTVNGQDNNANELNVSLNHIVFDESFSSLVSNTLSDDTILLQASVNFNSRQPSQLILWSTFRSYLNNGDNILWYLKRPEDKFDLLVTQTDRTPFGFCHVKRFQDMPDVELNENLKNLLTDDGNTFVRKSNSYVIKIAVVMKNFNSGFYHLVSVGYKAIYMKKFDASLTEVMVEYNRNTIKSQRSFKPSYSMTMTDTFTGYLDVIEKPGITVPTLYSTEMSNSGNKRVVAHPKTPQDMNWVFIPCKETTSGYNEIPNSNTVIKVGQLQQLIFIKTSHPTAATVAMFFSNTPSEIMHSIVEPQYNRMFGIYAISNITTHVLCGPYRNVRQNERGMKVVLGANNKLILSVMNFYDSSFTKYSKLEDLEKVSNLTLPTFQAPIVPPVTVRPVVLPNSTVQHNGGHLYFVVPQGSGSVIGVVPEGPIGSAINAACVPEGPVISAISAASVPERPVSNAINAAWMPERPVSSAINAAHVPEGPVISAVSAAGVPEKPISNTMIIGVVPQEPFEQQMNEEGTLKQLLEGTKEDVGLHNMEVEDCDSDDSDALVIDELVEVVHDSPHPDNQDDTTLTESTTTSPPSPDGAQASQGGLTHVQIEDLLGSDSKKSVNPFAIFHLPNPQTSEELHEYRRKCEQHTFELFCEALAVDTKKYTKLELIKKGCDMIHHLQQEAQSHRQDVMNLLSARDKIFRKMEQITEDLPPSEKCAAESTIQCDVLKYQVRRCVSIPPHFMMDLPPWSMYMHEDEEEDVTFWMDDKETEQCEQLKQQPD